MPVDKQLIQEFTQLCQLGSIFSVNVLTDNEKMRCLRLYQLIRKDDLNAKTTRQTT